MSYNILKNDEYTIDLKLEKEEFINNSSLTSQDMIEIIDAEIRKRGVAGHHIKSMNNFYSKGINQIVTNIFTVENTFTNLRNKTEEDKQIKEINFKVSFTDVKLDKPTTASQTSGFNEPQYPINARRNNETYSAPLYASMDVKTTIFKHNGMKEEFSDRVNNLKIGMLPIMARTTKCNLSGLSNEQLRKIGEDPNEHGGYLSISGSEWVINCLENTTINDMHIYRNPNPNERIYGHMICKPGDAYENSYEVILHISKDDMISIELNYMPYRKIYIPFYLIFRALGMTSDREIIDTIVYGVDNEDNITNEMKDIIENCYNIKLGPIEHLRTELNVEKVISGLAMFLHPEMVDNLSDYGKMGGAENLSDDTINAEIKRLDSIAVKLYDIDDLEPVKDEYEEFITKEITGSDEVIAAIDKRIGNLELIKFYNAKINKLLDKLLLPNLGNAVSDRIKKARYLGHLINKVLKVDLGILEESDRNSFKNKRVHAAGTSFAKVLKTNFNTSVVKKIRDKLTDAYKNNSFSDVRPVDVIANNVKPDDLEKNIISAVNTGDAKISVSSNIEIANRMDTQRVEPKNLLNRILNLNKISVSNSMSNEHSEQADLGRRYHPSPIYRVCMARTPEGSSVGLKKEFACTCSITQPTESYLIRKIMDSDSKLIKNFTPSEFTARRLSKIIINGDWVGCVEDSLEFVHRYRNYRRYDHIQHDISICWELHEREIKIWTDVGRLLAPLVIVYNNEEEYEAAQLKGSPIEFKQWTKFTPDMAIALAMGRTTIEDLRKKRVIEYIASEEQEQYYVAVNIFTLVENQSNPLKRYNYVGIDQAVFGLVALSTPFPEYSNASRTTLLTNHITQGISWYAINHPYRIDKNTTLQHYIEQPLVTRFTNKFTLPTSQNAMVALITNGWNQEDSIVINKASVDAGLYSCAFFTYEEVKKESNETIGKIDYSRTMDIKKNANYELVNDKGIVKIGSIVNKNDVLVVKTAPLKEPVDQYTHTDKSLICRSGPLRVVDIATTLDYEKNILIRIKMISYRPTGVGDKLSSNTGNKGIISKVVDSADMPYTESGEIIDLLVNAQSIPTRMALNQLLECLSGTYADKRGAFIDGTAFMGLDFPEIVKKLADMGLDACHRRLFNGKTGKWFDTLIFTGLTSYMRLLKFVIDDEYATFSGPVSALTHQPLVGRNNDGALKIGEMETWTWVVHGAMMSLEEKFYKDSDENFIYICEVCGTRDVIVNEKLNMFKCKHCVNDARIAKVKSCWASTYLNNLIASMGIKLKYSLDDTKYLKENDE